MNRAQVLAAVKALPLDPDHYVVVGSGLLAVHGLREADDVDVQVDDELWTQLVDRYGPSADGRKLALSGDVDAHRDSAYAPIPGLPPLAEEIAAAEIVEDIPFSNADHLTIRKRDRGEPKDLNDIELLERLRP